MARKRVEADKVRLGRQVKGPKRVDLGRLQRQLAALALLASPSILALAQEAVWTGGTGNWNDPTRWSTGQVPGSTTDAQVDGGQTAIDSRVDVNVNAAVGNLTIDAGDQVAINPGRQLTIHGANLLNHGTFSLNATGTTSGTRSDLRIAGDTTLAGSGVLMLTDNAGNHISGMTASDVLTNAAGHSIRGSGQLGNNFMGLNNQGLIDANQDTALVLNLRSGDEITRANTGTLQASGDGVLTVTGTALDNTGGTIQAVDSGTVNIQGSSYITGGTLATADDGAVLLSGWSTLDSLTNSGAVRINHGNTGRIAGTLTNDGTFSLNATGTLSSQRSDLQIAGDTTLAGSGVLTLTDNAGNHISGMTASDVLTNAAGHSIRGSGQLGDNFMGLNNQGLIDANQDTALVLNLRSGDGITRANTGTLQASGGGVLTVTGTTLDNTGGTIQAVDSGTVDIQGSSYITGGTLATAGDGAVLLSGWSRLDSLTNSGLVRINHGNTGWIAGTLTNDGTFSLNATGTRSGTRSDLRIAGDTTLAGGGVLTLTDNAGNRVYGVTASDVLTNAASHSIRGSGQLGNGAMGLHNQGLIDANQSTALTINLNNAEGVTRANTGTLQASGDGVLTVTVTTLDNTGGTIQAVDSGTVHIQRSSYITGGTLATADDGVILLSGSSTLDSLTNSGAVRINQGDTGRIAGALTNDGTFSLNATGTTSGNRSFLLIAGDATLAGDGVLALSNNAGNRIYGVTASDVLTNAAGHSIRGSGQLGNNFMGLNNQGLIDANQGVTLSINPATATIVDTDSGANVLNTGTLRGSGAGGLELTGGAFLNQVTLEALNGSNVTYTTSATTLNNNAGTLEDGIWRAVSTGDGATVSLMGAAVTTNQAEIALSGAGSVFRTRVGTSTNFTALETSLTTNQGTLRILDNRDYSTSNDLTNAGLLQLGGGTLDASSLTNTGTLTGHGTVIPRPVNSGLVAATGGTLALTGGVQGSGTVTIQPDGALDLGAATQASSAAFLDHQGTAADSLNLGSQDSIVSQDYTNANFGEGNAFDARANVIGSGQIIGEDAALTITGAVTPAGANRFTLDLGNVRGGTSTTVNYQVANTGTGADVRGAVQTAAGAGNITDARLSGSGVAAQNFGPIAAGEHSGNLAVTVTASSGGALDGQTLGLVSNFDNVDAQTIQITGMATTRAQGSATPAGPVDLGNFRVGQDGVSQNFTVENTTSGPGAERLGIGAATATGNFAATNDLGAGLIDGGSSRANALTASVSNGQAGLNTGALNIQYTTDGTAIDAGFTAIDSNTQSIALTATGFNMAAGSASPDPVVIANQRVGGTESQALAVSNVAPTGAFTEALNASFGTSTGDATDNAGNVALLAAGASDQLRDKPRL